MLRLILAFTIGVLILQALPWLPPWWAGLLLLVTAAIPWRLRPVLLALSLGFVLTLWRAEIRLAERWPEARQGEDITLIGHIASLPEWSPEMHAPRSAKPVDAPPENTWRFRFDPVISGVPSRIRVSWYRTTETPRGDECWQFTLRMKAPHGSQNPGGFDYEGWLFRQGIGGVATVREAQPCTVAASNPVLRMRQGIRDAIQRAVPKGPARALLIALVLGDSAELRDSDWDAFRLTGTSHLVAISGFNLAIVASLVFLLLRWAWGVWPPLTRHMPAQKAAAFGAAVFASIYALLAGFDPPVTRALAMLLIGLAALFLNRATQPFRVLALAWGVIVFCDPFSVLSAGMWLSFGAVAAILFLTTGRMAREPGWQQAVRVQLLLTLLLAPLTLYFFQGSSWITPFVNLVAVPWFALLTPLALVAVLLLWIWPALALLLLKLTAFLLAGTHTALLTLAEHYREGWLALSPSPWALLLALAGAVLLVLPRGWPLRPLGLLCVIPLLLPVSQAPKTGFDLAVLDVGQGLAVVVRTAHHTLLFDAGPAYEEGFDAGQSVVAPYLLKSGVRQLDVMMISHTDLDHRGGAPAVRRLLRPVEERGALAGTPCQSGQHWQWDGVDFSVLNGPDDALGDRSPDNNGGCVLKVSVKGHAVLLPADIEKEAEARLLATDPAALKAEVLVAPHHGSKTSSTLAFAAAVNPELVIFPAGYANQFHHPRPEVVARYQALGSALHMTGHEGAVLLHVNPETGVGAVQPWRQQWPRYWWAPVLPVPGVD